MDFQPGLHIRIKDNFRIIQMIKKLLRPGPHVSGSDNCSGVEVGISHLEKQNKTENSLGSSPVWSTDLQSDGISLNVIMFNLSTSIDVVWKDGVVWLGEILAGVQGFALT